MRVQAVGALLALSLLRLLRVARVLKLLKHSRHTQFLVTNMQESASELGTLTLLFFILLVPPSLPSSSG